MNINYKYITIMIIGNESVVKYTLSIFYVISICHKYLYKKGHMTLLNYIIVFTCVSIYISTIYKPVYIITNLCIFSRILILKSDYKGVNSLILFKFNFCSTLSHTRFINCHNTNGRFFSQKFAFLFFFL